MHHTCSSFICLISLWSKSICSTIYITYTIIVWINAIFVYQTITYIFLISANVVFGFGYSIWWSIIHPYMHRLLQKHSSISYDQHPCNVYVCVCISSVCLCVCYRVVRAWACACLYIQVYTYKMVLILFTTGTTGIHHIIILSAGEYMHVIKIDTKFNLCASS